MREPELGHEEALGLKEEQKEAFEEKRKSLSDLKEEVLNDLDFGSDFGDIAFTFGEFIKYIEFGDDVGHEEGVIKISKYIHDEEIEMLTFSVSIKTGEIIFRNDNNMVGFRLKSEGGEVKLFITLEDKKEVGFSSLKELKDNGSYADKYSELKGEIDDIFLYVMQTKNNTISPYLINTRRGSGRNKESNKLEVWQMLPYKVTNTKSK